MAKNNNSQLYSAIIDMVPTGKKVELSDKMKNLFGAELQKAGISVPVFNAMANVVGRERKSWFRLWNVKRNVAEPASSSAQGYEADDISRYFFEYGLSTGDNIILEYSRFEKFEIRASLIADGEWKELKFSDGIAHEAVAAMLFAIMLSEGTDVLFSTAAINFSHEYQKEFESGWAEGMNTIRALYRELVDCVDPKLVDDNAGFKMSSNSVNKTTGRLKRILEGEKIGYTKIDEMRVFFASDVEALPLADGGRHEEVPLIFTILEGVLRTTKRRKVKKLEANMYPINPDRTLDEEDKSRLLTIPDWYVPVPNVLNIAQLVSGSQHLAGRPFRNIMMRGPAGSGKTEGAKALASMFGSPYGVITGHAEMEFFDLTSNLFPNTDSNMSSNEEIYEFLLYALRDSGMELPSLVEIASMPDAIFRQLTGKENDEAGEAECLAALVAKLLSVCKKDHSMFSGENSKFKVIHSDLTLGFQKGWLVELQEMNTILKPGVLVGLNNILEHGQLRLPTGETITRHPDTVIVFTQNVGYAGTTDGNQSVYSRIELKCDLNHPSEDEMIGRIQMHVPEISEADCRTIVQTVLRIQENCAAEIEGGSVGTREAISWAKATVLLNGNMREAAELTILPSVGEDADDIALVRTNIHQSIAEVE